MHWGSKNPCGSNPNSFNYKLEWYKIRKWLCNNQIKLWSYVRIIVFIRVKNGLVWKWQDRGVLVVCAELPNDAWVFRSSRCNIQYICTLLHGESLFQIDTLCVKVGSTTTTHLNCIILGLGMYFPLLIYCHRKSARCNVEWWIRVNLKWDNMLLIWFR